MSLEKHILNLLLAAEPRPATLRTIGNNLDGVLPRPTPGEVADKIAQLERAGCVVCVRDDLDENLLRYAITTKGRAWRIENP